MKTFLLVSFLSSVAAWAQTQTQVTIGEIRFSGKGCRGTASVAYQDDRQGFSILFDKTALQVGRAEKKTYLKSSCKIEVPFHVPTGLSVAVTNVDYRGAAIVPAGGLARFRERAMWSGAGIRQLASRPLAKDFRGPSDENFFLSQKAGIVAWSPCKESHPKLTLDLAWDVLTNRNKDETFFSLDSSDGIVNQSVGVNYGLQTQVCSRRSPPTFSFFFANFDL